MGHLLLRPPAPSYAITTSSTDFSKELLEKTYSKSEIYVSVETARRIGSTVDFQDPFAVEHAWKNVHIITSDKSWGKGIGSYVDYYLKEHTRAYMRALIENTSQYLDAFSIANFMTRHFRKMNDPGYIRLLRAHLLAFPETFGTSSTMMEMQRMHYRDVDEWMTLGPMMMAASRLMVMPSVMLTLLQAGVESDSRNGQGRSALMLVCECMYGDHHQKVDLLLNYGASIELMDSLFHNAFHAAIKMGNESTLKKLLQARKRRIEDAVYAGEDNLDNCNKSVDEESTLSDCQSCGCDSESECEEMSEEEEEVDKVDYDARWKSHEDWEASAYERRLTAQIIFQNDPHENPEFASRNRNKHLLYIDPLKTTTYDDKSLLVFASIKLLQFSIREKERHVTMVDNLVANQGVPTEGNRGCIAGPITRIGGNNPKQHFGLARWEGREGDESYSGSLVFAIQKYDYNIRVMMGVTEAFNFIDIKRSKFPFNERPSYQDLMMVFQDMKLGAQFDYVAKDGFCTGKDFEMDFYVSEHEVVDGHHEYKKTGLIWSNYERTKNWSGQHKGKICFQFPKGPLPTEVFYDETFEAEDLFYAADFFVNKNFSFLQEALVHKCRFIRCHLFNTARSVCNPLTTEERGFTALQLLERNLKRQSRFDLAGADGVAGLPKNDRGLLRRVRKDHDAMVIQVNRTGLVNQKNSILFNQADQKVSDQYNERKAAKKPRFNSIFHQLPDDVCANILRFM